MTEWADHSAELARKSLEHLTDVMTRRTEAVQFVTADTLSAITQGLIPYDTWLVIDTVRLELRQKLQAK